MCRKSLSLIHISIMAHSPEEVVARDFICFGKSDAAVVVCDATCLERNLNLVLQVLEITPKTILCLNLMDEAKKKKIYIDTNLLSKKLGIPVIQTTARDKKGLENLLETKMCIRDRTDGEPKTDDAAKMLHIARMKMCIRDRCSCNGFLRYVKT